MKTRRDSVAVSYFFFFADFFAAFFFAGIGITSFWPRVVRYIDTLTS